MKKIKSKILFYIGCALAKLHSFNSKTFKDDGRPSTDFPIVYFLDEKSITPLNASLHSVYKKWNELPEVKILVADNTAPEVFRKKMVKWPKTVTIIPWQEAAGHFKSIGNNQIHHFASSELLGRKFTGIQYVAKQGKMLYSDTDVLWFKNPSPSFPDTDKSYMMLGQEANNACYSHALIAFLKDDAFSKPAMNSGVIFAQGDFSTYSKWDTLCNFFGTAPDFNDADKADRYFVEQTSMAILTNEFGKAWEKNEVFIGVDDMTEIIPKKYRKIYKSMYARHYVNTKPWIFWRDYIFFIK